MRTDGEQYSTRGIRIRIGFLVALLAAGFGTVAWRAVDLQVHQADRLGSLARDQYLRDLKQKPRRGAITDRNGALLAGNAEADSIFADPREFAGAGRGREIARLAKALQLDPRALEKKLGRGGRFAWVKRRVAPAEAEAVKGMKLAGIGFVKETRRYYPHRELAGQVIGVVGDDGEGLEGVERAWDDSLQGAAGQLPSLRDARGFHLLGAGPTPEKVLEGHRVELTIDQGLQLATERSLAQAVAQARARSGMAVAMDPATGEILALANVPLLNPNAPSKEDLRNRAVLDTYEPGSTMKAFVMARALEEEVLRPEDSIFCENGRWNVAGKVIHDHKGIGWTPPARIMAVSSNICSAKIGQRLGRDRLQRAFLAFGLGERTQTGLAAEPRGVIPYPRAEISAITMGFGQGMTATCLQITTAMAAIANRGVLMKPWLVRRVVDPATGAVLSEATPTPVRRAVSAENAALVTRWLEGVVSEPDGTGKRARLAGWRVAGKTGTAQKADPVTGGYARDRQFASFVGFAPADAPRVAIGVFIDEPRGEIYGGEVAAPVFREIAAHALQSGGVPPTDAAAVPAFAVAPGPEALADREEAEEPAAMEDAPRQAPRGQGQVAVPSVQGLPARAALRLLEASDLSADVRGSGRVSGQVPRPGQVVERGTRVRLVLAPPG